jgi:hypothetical protein
MKISLSWLADFVDVELEPRSRAEAHHGRAAGRSITRAATASGVIVAEVRGAPHPKAGS